MQIPLIKGESVDSSSQWRDSLPQNMYAVDKPTLGAEGFMTSYPGLEFVAVGDLDTNGRDRGAIWVSTPSFIGQYRVIGGSLSKIEITDGFLNTLDSLGLVPGYDLVKMAYSFNNLAIVADGRLFYYNPTDGLREIIDNEVGTPIDIVWGDNLFILTDGTNIYHSDPLDEENYLPLDFGSAEFQPDPSLGLGFNEDSELIAFGTLSVEHFTNVGSENFVFRRIKQKAQKIGIVSTVSKGYYGNTYYMLGGRENSQFGAYITESGASQKISSVAVDKILSGYLRSDMQESIVEVVEFDGTILCLIHLPKDYVLCFNQSAAKKFGIESAWSVLTSRDAENPESATQLAHRAYNYIHDKTYNRWFCGDKVNFRVGLVDPDRGDQYHAPQELIMDSPLIKLETLSIDSLDIETVPGQKVKSFFYDPFGTPLEDESTVFVSLTYNGRTHGKEWTKLYGRNNDYSTRFYIRRLGYVRDIVGFRFRAYTRARMSFANFNVEAS